MQNSGSPQLDLSGKLIIKVALGEDIRRIPIHNEDITYDELVLMMQRVYRGKLSTNDEITIKYKDEDGDLITIFDSSDLTFAIQCSRILKITLFVGGSSKSVIEPQSAAAIRQELQGIRDRVISLLDHLESSSLVAGTQAISLSDGFGAKGDSVVKNGVVSSGASPAVNAQGGKEFDPLSSQKSVDESTQNKVASSFGVDGVSSGANQYDRAATPDSVSSIGSSASHQVRQQQFPPSSTSQQQHPAHVNSHQAPSSGTPQPQQHPQAPTPQAPQHAQTATPPQHPQQQQQYYQGQQGYTQNQAGQPGQPPHAYAGQPGYQQHHQQQPQQPTQQQQQQQQQQTYDPAMYGQYGQSYPQAPGQPAPSQPAQQGQPTMMFPGQPGGPSPYGQAPGMPQQPAKAAGYPPNPGAPGAGQSPNNPYSRGGYGSGYPRPTAGYPQ